MIKTLTLLVKRDDWTAEAFHQHWREVHAPLAAPVQGIRRYVQSQIINEVVRKDVAEIGLAVDGIAEVWYDDEAAMQAARSSPEGQALLADGALFVGRSRTFVIRESEIIALRD